jgi:hypothetical protein
MSQATANILNMSRTLYRAAVNAIVQAIQSLNSGATAPTETYAYMWWADAPNDLLKQRNAANTAWISILTLSTGKPVNLGVGSDTQAYDAQLSSLIQQNSRSTAYTAVLTDGGKHLLHPTADTTARTFTIPANSSVAYPIGTAITFVNQASAGVLTIAITTDTMRLAGAGTTGSRTLAANGIATALKITSTEWIISGVGLT